jgi:hypothetical protein
MTEALDRFAKALASGTSRRATLGGLFAGLAASLPWTAEAKKNKKQRRRRRRERKRKKQFQKFQAACEQWCAQQFGASGDEFDACVKQAKEGKGACYSSAEQGPGYFCTEVEPCGDLNCCPNIFGGGPVTSGECCETECEVLNGTLVCIN